MYFKLLFKKIFNIEGRINRKKYTAFMVLFFFCCFTIDILDIDILDKALSVYSNIDNIFYWLHLIVITLLAITFFVINVIFTIKRLHDLNLNGWWCIWYFLLPPIQITLCFFKGTPSPNRYGEPPEY
jgi:uncharacterized membrane protein YhaH (DUF805 family)